MKIKIEKEEEERANIEMRSISFGIHTRRIMMNGL